MRAYWFYVSFTGLGVGFGLERAGLGLGLITAGLDYNTGKKSNDDFDKKLHNLGHITFTGRHGNTCTVSVQFMFR